MSWWKGGRGDVAKMEKDSFGRVSGQHLSEAHPLLKTQLPRNHDSPKSHRRKNEKEGDFQRERDLVEKERGEADKVEKDSFGTDFHSLGCRYQLQFVICHRHRHRHHQAGIG